ncbi:MAG: LytTR family DNA-binding domain-containing protein [Lachnospiraceae bacterium]|jgi:DNA-binding LytR/AlgR family response regulator|nr:LytTR family DNA-binding domain-containing protein [Lachnospiraceae bacterium]
MESLRIAICDDEAAAAEELREKLKALEPDALTFPFTSIEAFMGALDEAPFDIVFMDIEWNGRKSGIDYASGLYERFPDLQAIYVTGYGEKYSQRIFLSRSNLCGYLVKPADPRFLSELLDKAKQNVMAASDAKLLVQNRGMAENVPYSEILYFENRGHKTLIFLDSRTLELNERLEVLRKTLPANFVDSHKSYTVNMNYIRHFNNDGITLFNGLQIPVSRSKYAEAREKYFRYSGQRV